MSKFFKKRINLIAFLTLLCFLISLAPILYVSFFAHPTADDYVYAAFVHHTSQNGGGFFEIIRAACSEVKSTYFTWQGTFSAVFLFALQPAAFSPNLYFLTTFLLVGVLTVSTAFFYETILVRWLGGSKSFWIIITSLTLFESIQFVPSKVEGFYWYNGSVYYTFFYSLALLLAALLIRILLVQSVRRKIILTVLSSLLAVVLGGGNYTTALVTTLVYVLATVLIFYNKVSGKQYLLTPLMFLLVSFIISMAAPGNAVRAAEWASQSLSPAKAIGLSLFCGFRYIGEWSALPQITIFLFLTPLLYRVAQKCELSFQKPFLVCLLAFCVFCSQITPPMYAEGNVGPDREINIYYYSYYLLIVFCIFYLCGWVNRKYPESMPIGKIYNILHDQFVPIVLSFCLLFLSGCFAYKMINMTSVDTAKAAVEKSVNIYNEEYYADLEKLQKEKDVCKIRDLDAPDFFGSLSIKESPDYWVNNGMAIYFGVRQVVKE